MRIRFRRLPLTVKQILAWAKAHQRRRGRWPHPEIGTIPEAPPESWLGVNSALGKGQRGLLGGASLFKLLDERCGQTLRKLPLTVDQVLSWMESHRQRTGRWRIVTSGAVFDAPRENWRAIDMALRYGNRGLPAGLSLRRLRVLIRRAGLV